MVNAVTKNSPVVSVGAAPSPPETLASVDAGEVRREELRKRLAACERPPTAKEAAMAEAYCTNGGNATAAYREAYGVEIFRSSDSQAAYFHIQKPGMQRYIRELRAAAAAVAHIDVAAILESDRAIVAAAEHADKISEQAATCCRYCHGINGLFQWVDEDEYMAEWSAVLDWNAEAGDKKQRDLPLNTGGFGYDHQREPERGCTHCKGQGHQQTIFHPTHRYGLARPLFKGVKTGKNGTEILMHDVDKAKERLLRAAGAFGDDAASVARGAAAGAAAGAAVGGGLAKAVADRAAAMSTDEIRKAYLTLIG